MNTLRQSCLVAMREIRERGRSRAFLASMILLAVGVAAVIVLPTLFDTSGGSRAVGLTGSVPVELVGAIQSQGEAVGTTLRTRRYDTVVAGQEAVRDGEVDVLVVDAQRLEWQRRADEHLQAVVTGAIQLVAVQQRAAAAGISPADLLTMVAPVRVENVHPFT